MKRSSHVSSLWDLHIWSRVALFNFPQVSVICKVKPIRNHFFKPNNDAHCFSTLPRWL